jgi:hypothetical protein
MTKKKNAITHDDLNNIFFFGHFTAGLSAWVDLCYPLTAREDVNDYVIARIKIFLDLISRFKAFGGNLGLGPDIGISKHLQRLEELISKVIVPKIKGRMDFKAIMEKEFNSQTKYKSIAADRLMKYLLEKRESILARQSYEEFRKTISEVYLICRKIDSFISQKLRSAPLFAFTIGIITGILHNLFLERVVHMQSMLFTIVKTPEVSRFDPSKFIEKHLLSNSYYHINVELPDNPLDVGQYVRVLDEAVQNIKRPLSDKVLRVLRVIHECALDIQYKPMTVESLEVFWDAIQQIVAGRLELIEEALIKKSPKLRDSEEQSKQCPKMITTESLSESIAHPEQPIVGFKAIFAALNLDYKEDEVRPFARYCKKHKSPILFGKSGERPEALRSQLVSWWSSIQSRFEQIEERTGNTQATLYETYQSGTRSETIYPNWGGHEKKKRSRS